MEGTYAGRMVIDRLNLWNSNPVAAEIAQRTLSAICHATGVLTMTSTGQLHGIPIKARIVKTPARDGYDPGNDVKQYAPMNDPVANGGQPAQFNPSAPTGGAAAPPWAAPAQGAPAPTAAPATPPWGAPPATAPAPQPAGQGFTPPNPFGAPPAAGANTAPPGPPAGGDMTPPWAR
jgi:hypothetical protein